MSAAMPKPKFLYAGTTFVIIYKVVGMVVLKRMTPIIARAGTLPPNAKIKQAGTNMNSVALFIPILSDKKPPISLPKRWGSRKS